MSVTAPCHDAHDVDEQRRRVLALLRRHGWNATSFQTLEPGLSYWFDGDEACVAYADTGGAWVAAGAPIAATARLGEVAARFVAEARRRGRRASFFAVERRFLDATGMAAECLGQQPIWDPHTWQGVLRQARSLREQVRRARAKGVSVRLAAADGAERAALAALASRWAASRPMAPMGFLVTLDLFGFAAERRYLLAEQGGRLVGALSAVPVYGRNGWFFEDLLRDGGSPNGTSELLVDAAMRQAASEGARYVTLGLSPLSGPVGGWLRAARDWSTPLYDFHGLASFKTKLRPQRWDPIYLASPDGTPVWLSLHDALVAFAHGSLVGFGWRTLRHSARLRRVALGALAVALLAVVLAVAATR